MTKVVMHTVDGSFGVSRHDPDPTWMSMILDYFIPLLFAAGYVFNKKDFLEAFAEELMDDEEKTQ